MAQAVDAYKGKSCSFADIIYTLDECVRPVSVNRAGFVLCLFESFAELGDQDRDDTLGAFVFVGVLQNKLAVFIRDECAAYGDRALLQIHFIPCQSAYLGAAQGT